MVKLTGVPETMLWTLHNRATEARRKDTYLVDPEAIRVDEAIDFPYEERFGKPEDMTVVRAKLVDDAVRPWIASHPDGAVVELACGLETQFSRVDNGRVRWWCVDLPEAIDVREKLLPPTERCQHIRSSAFDLAWMDRVDASHGVMITAQGLFMYFPEDHTRRLITAIVERWPGVEILFDTIPAWFSRQTVAAGGWRKTRDYRVPPMPWGISRSKIEPTLRGWSNRIARVETKPYLFARGIKRLWVTVGAHVPLARDMTPVLSHVYTR
ncbi:MAG TPA: class I SAM-dependent methyltransferase [Kofleriaceae bacterium]